MAFPEGRSMTGTLLALVALFASLFAPGLALAGGIAGQVTDARSGAPLAGAMVAAWSVFPDSTGADPPPPGGDPGDPGQGGGSSGGDPGQVGTAITDSAGNYLIEDLSPSEYFVQASADSHLAEFYPGTQNPEEATPIPVGAATMIGIDFALGIGSCVHGRVTDASTGEPIAGAFVSLAGRWMPPWPPEPPLPPDPPLPPLPPDGWPPSGGGIPPEPGFGAITDPDGRYALCGLAPGEYWVLAWAEGYLGEYHGDARCLSEADPVVVDDGDLFGIDFALAEGGRIAGRVLDGAASVPGAFVRAWMAVEDSTVVPPDPNGGYPGTPVDCAGPWGAETIADDAGNYVLAGLASGSYVVLAEAPERPDLLPTFHGGGQDPQSAQPVLVTAPGTTGAIDIVLERGGAISGTVRDEETGEPLADIWVEIYLSIEGGPGPWRYLGAVTDMAGAYRIAGVPAGEQRVVASAWDRGYELEFFQEAATPETATPILIAPPAEVLGIDFTLRRSQPGDGGIGGRVAAEDGQPLPGAVVTAISLTGYAGFGLADSAGYYWISSLPSDEYVVLAAAGGRVGLFYDQAMSWEDATPVRVDGPTSGIDFALPPAGGGRGVISGRVTDADGTGIPGAGIYAEPELETSPAGFALSGAGGRYAITGLGAGRYRIRATRPGLSDAYHAQGSPGSPPDWVTVSGEPVTDVLIVLGAGSPPPTRLASEPSVPNPFRDQVAIRLQADRIGVPIVVDLYAVDGRHVRRLELETTNPGRQEITWDGRDTSGAPVPSGFYVYRAALGGEAVSGRLVLLR
jgi:protocatechuate 3,4-dioxygenase beta subunit